MKATRKVLGLLLVIGMLLSCAAASYATATKAPKFTTSKLDDANYGDSYEAEIAVEGNTDSSDRSVNVTITDAASNDLKSYGLTVTNTSDGGLKLSAPKMSSDVLLKRGSYKFTVTATNQYKKKDTDTKWTSGKTTKQFTLKLKSSAPKITTSKLDSTYSVAGTESNTISITGTKPFSIDVYIEKNDAIKAGLADTKADIYIFSRDVNDPSGDKFGLTVTSADADDGITITLKTTAGKGLSYKNLPITIKAQNPVTANVSKKAVTKKLKATMTGSAPVWYILRGPAKLGTYPIKVSDDFDELMFTAKSADALSLDFFASGDQIMKLTVSPKSGTAGLTIKTSTDAKYNGKSYVSVDVYASNSTEAKTTKLKLVAENGDGKATLNLKLIGQEKPVIKYDAKKYYKDVEQDKKFSFTPSLKSGTKPIKWYIAANSPTKSADLKASYDIEIDEDKGTLSGTPGNVTLSNDKKTWARRTVWIYAQNEAGSSDIASVDIGVIGSKVKLDSDTKEFKILRTVVVSGDNYRLKADDVVSSEVTWEVTQKSGKTGLSSYIKGLSLSKDGTISSDAGASLVATKATSVPITMNHYGAKSTASVKITVIDPSPIIVSTDKGRILIKGVTVDKSSSKTTKAYTGSMTLVMSNDTKATGNSKVTWKISEKPGEKVLSAKLAKGSDKNGNDAKLTITLGKGKELDNTFTSGDASYFNSFTDTVEITATNSGADKDTNSATITLTIQVTSGDAFLTTSSKPEVEAKADEDETIGETSELEEDVVTDEELTAELGEGDLTLGAERTVGMLTDAQAAILADGKFVIAAILPEINATVDGQYGLEVDLAEYVNTGAKLYWFAFPKDAEASEDDEIIDFFELDGTDTEVVPEDHIVAAYPWLRKDVTYGPVIAVKAEDAEEGDAVSEDELEEKAEGEAESETKEIAEPTDDAE